MSKSAASTLLQINNLNVFSENISRSGRILHDINLTVDAGRITGIEGDSGSGKTVLAKTIMGLVEAPLYVESGNVVFDGRNITHLSDGEFSEIRGSEISMILQNPMSSLDPLMRVGDQISEAVLLHEKTAKKEAKERALQFLEKVGFDNPSDRYRAYPYEMSGGQCQRVMIAMAMIGHPKLLIADEPTTSLDVTNEKQILSLIRSLCREYGTGVILISHNLELLRDYCDCIYTIQDGAITGFYDCADDIVLPSRFGGMSIGMNDNDTCDENRENGKAQDKFCLESREVIISCRNLCKDYTLPSGRIIHALSGVSLDIFRGECLGLAGDSGSGKTTLARTIAGLQSADSGKVIRRIRNPQMIFQDPYSSLDPRMKIKDIIAEPMKAAFRKGGTGKPQKSVKELLDTVHLPESYMDCYPYQLSGGQRQKVSIARAISTAPEFIICDESVSALDRSIQYQILDLLIELKEKYSMTYLFISHDMNVIDYISDRVIRMNDGRIV